MEKENRTLPYLGQQCARPGAPPGRDRRPSRCWCPEAAGTCQTTSQPSRSPERRPPGCAWTAWCPGTCRRTTSSDGPPLPRTRRAAWPETPCRCRRWSRRRLAWTPVALNPSPSRLNKTNTNIILQISSWQLTFKHSLNIWTTDSKAGSNFLVHSFACQFPTPLLFSAVQLADHFWVEFKACKE